MFASKKSQLWQIAKSVSIAGNSPGADVATRNVCTPAQLANDPSSRFENMVMPADAAASQNAQDTMLRIQASHTTQLIASGEWSTSVVHEVIQPLLALVVKGERCKQLLDRDRPPLDKIRATVAAMISSACRMGDISRRLRALLVEEDVQRAEPNLDRIIKQAVALVESEVLRDGVSLRLNLSPDLPLVLGDSVQLHQAIINFLASGLQAMALVSEWPREPFVRSQKLDLNHVGIMVQYSGTGIKPDDMERLFDTFSSVEPTGLESDCPCRRITGAHGGLIWAASDNGRGAAFYFALPAIDAVAE